VTARRYSARVRGLDLLRKQVEAANASANADNKSPGYNFCLVNYYARGKLGLGVVCSGILFSGLGFWSLLLLERGCWGYPNADNKSPGYNFCLVNYYASGDDSIAFHSDDERF
jgi:alkylated DNA repair dioxygenase AlkB